jgi:hypothetical protein
MTINLTWEEYQRIKALKVLDLEICDYRHVNILNLGWKPWGKWFCNKHEKEHVLCSELCLPASKNIIGCELVRKRTKRTGKPVKTNKSYILANCYLCNKQLKGASKKGIIKNRNNPSFWGIGSVYKIMCLRCIGKEFYKRLSSSKRKTFNKYLKRGYE